MTVDFALGFVSGTAFAVVTTLVCVAVSERVVRWRRMRRFNKRVRAAR